MSSNNIYPLFSGLGYKQPTLIGFEASSKSLPQGTMGPREVVRLSVADCEEEGPCYQLLWDRSKDTLLLEDGSNGLKEELQQRFGFSPESVDTIMRTLGKENPNQGWSAFDRLVRFELVTIERVGFRKDGAPKFYLMINAHKAAGTDNRFHKGFSRRGTKRAVTRLKIPEEASKPAMIKTSLNAILLSDAIKNTAHHQEGHLSGVSRVMDTENEVRVSQLGGKDLQRFLDDDNTLSREERWELYQNILKGVSTIHRHGFVHQDLKQGNVVLGRKGEKRAASMIIDLDTLLKRGERAKPWGTPAAFPPEKMLAWSDRKHQSYYPFVEPSEDIWGAMFLICDTEENMASDSLLSHAFTERFWDYDNTLQYTSFTPTMFQERLAFLKGRDNLFWELEPETPLDKIVFSMAYLDYWRRATSAQIMEEFQKARPAT